MDNTHPNECLPIIFGHLQESFEHIRKTPTENQIVTSILSSLRCFELYKDLQLHTKVKQLCPWEQLSLESSKKITAIKQNSKEETISIDTRDLFLIELLDWFKKEFFTWFQEPNCKNCPTTQMKFAKYGECTAEEKRWAASRVEIYACPNCKSEYRFPRYNHPLKLLDTRTGRCGEWANCFTSMCIVFNYEVRKVLEMSDHVWLEVFSESQQRWVHCDPCENALDTPLMYEAGWNKQISFCIAISDREIQDVTWNYTLHPREVLERRQYSCDEKWLLNTIMFITRTLQNKLDPQIVREMNERRINELVGYLWLPNQKKRELKSNELLGRQSGSLMWRVARGEISGKEDGGLCKVDFTFKPTLDKAQDDCYAIRFNCVNDEYAFEGIRVKDWASCVHVHKNICRKVENDWKMTYLSRRENSNCEQSGFIEWKIDLRELTSDWKSIEIFMLSKVYENGVIKMYVSSQPEKIKLRINENERNQIKRDQFPVNCASLSITVEFSGGRGNCGWQHAQLFRQNLFTDSATDGLEILIKF